jgi:c-di-GMP-binding flagellar brake protein YcgR
MEKVTDKTRITVLLEKLLKQRDLLTIKLSNQPSPFSSAIIEVDRDNDCFILDELKPEKGDELLRQDPTLHIEGHLDGVSINFDSTVIEFGSDNNIPFYKLPIPGEIDYHQRRQAVRVRLSAANPLPISFKDPNGRSFDAEIEDLSVGGLRARFKTDLPHSLETGDELTCSFLIPPDNKEKINCKFIIRVIQHEKDTSTNRPAFMGGQFLSLEKPLERKLQRAIMTLQRALRQKEAY